MAANTDSNTRIEYKWKREVWKFFYISWKKMTHAFMSSALNILKLSSTKKANETLN